MIFDYFKEKKVYLIAIQTESTYLTKDKVYIGIKEKFSNGLYYEVITDTGYRFKLLSHSFKEIKNTKLLRLLFE